METYNCVEVWALAHPAENIINMITARVMNNFRPRTSLNCAHIIRNPKYSALRKHLAKIEVYIKQTSIC